MHGCNYELRQILVLHDPATRSYPLRQSVAFPYCATMSWSRVGGSPQRAVRRESSWFSGCKDSNDVRHRRVHSRSRRNLFASCVVCCCGSGTIIKPSLSFQPFRVKLSRNLLLCKEKMGDQASPNHPDKDRKKDGSFAFHDEKERYRSDQPSNRTQKVSSCK